MDGNDDYAEAVRMLEQQESAPRGTPEDMSVMAECQVRATLAVAVELRRLAMEVARTEFTLPPRVVTP